MCENANNVPVGVTSNIQQVVEQPRNKVSEKQKQYYLEQVRLLYPTVSPESPEVSRLWTLLRKTKRIINMLTYFNRPWVSGCGDIQKACAYYLAHAGLTKEKQETFIHVQREFAYTICHLAACSDFIAKMQRCFRNQEKELRQFIDLQKEKR